MKNCSEINEMISLYIDNVLDEDTRKEFEEHINGCPSCKNELEEITTVAGLCADIPEVELPEGFASELHQRLMGVKESEDSAKKLIVLRNRVVKIGSSIAACLVLVVILKGFFTDVNMLRESQTAKPAQQAEAYDYDIQQSFAGDAKRALRDEAKAYEDANGAGAGTKGEEAAPRVMFKDEQPQQKTVGDGATAFRFNKEKDTNQDTTVTATMDKSTETEAVQEGSLANTQLTLSFSECIAVKEKRSAGVVVTVENPADGMEKVKICAAAYGGELYGGEYGSSEKSPKLHVAGEDTVISVRIPNSQYEQFTDSMKKAFEGVAVEFGAVSGESITGRLDELNKALNEQNTKINGLQEKQDVSNPDELNRLKDERAVIEEEIAQLERDTQYTLVNITIRRKEDP